MRRAGVDRISATIRAPYRGGLEYMARTRTFNCTKEKRIIGHLHEDRKRVSSIGFKFRRGKRWKNEMD